MNYQKPYSGKWILCHSDGKKFITGNYLNGEQYGVFKWYKTNGELWRKFYYI
jgi:antitoxin component YwqK of YwqJK toxin-antitoxin module